MKLFKKISKLALVGLACVGLQFKAPAQTYTISVSGWLHFGPYMCLSNAVVVPTNVVANVEVGTNLTALTPMIPIPPGVDVAVWADYTGGANAGTSNLWLNFGASAGPLTNPPASYGQPTVTNGLPSPWGTNFSLFSSNQTVKFPLLSASNNVGYAVIPKSSLVGVKALQLMSASGDHTNAAGVTLNKAWLAFDGPPGAVHP